MRQCVSVLEDTLIFKQGTDDVNHWKQMNFNTRLYFFSSSFCCKLNMTKDDIPFYFLKVQNKYFSSSGILNVKQNGGVRLFINNLRWRKVNIRDVVASVSSDCQGQKAPCQSPYFRWMIVAIIHKMFHCFYFLASKTSRIVYHACFVLCPNFSVQDPKHSFLRFRGKYGQGENFAGIDKCNPLRWGYSISLTHRIGWGIWMVLWSKCHCYFL